MLALPPEKKGVLWDVDGTLLESKRCALLASENCTVLPKAALRSDVLPFFQAAPVGCLRYVLRGAKAALARPRRAPSGSGERHQTHRFRQAGKRLNA